MIEYLIFILLCTLDAVLGATFYYLYSLLEMAEASINDLLPEVPHNPSKLDMKQQKLIKCVLTENSKQYLGKVYTEEQINKLGAEEVDKHFSDYKAKLSGQMVKSLGDAIFKIYSMRACAVLGMTNQDAPSEDLESDPFINSALQRSTCELYHRFGSFLAPLSVRLITNRYYSSEKNVAGTKNVRKNRADGRPDES